MQKIRYYYTISPKIVRNFLVVLIFINVNQESYNDFKYHIITETPAMEYFFENFTIVGVNPNANESFWIYLLFFGVAAAFFVMMLMFIVIPIRFVVLMRRNKKILSGKTYKLNIILFQILMVQILLAIIFLIVPAILSLVVIEARVQGGGSYIMLITIMPSLHFVGDVLSLLYIKVGY